MALETSGHRYWMVDAIEPAGHQPILVHARWAFIEAANCVVLNQTPWEGRQVVQLYQRLRRHKGHVKAGVVVARPLAEAT